MATKAGIAPFLTHVALLERKYRVISRPAPELATGKKRARADADAAAHKAKGKAPATATSASAAPRVPAHPAPGAAGGGGGGGGALRIGTTAAASARDPRVASASAPAAVAMQYRVICLPPDADWDVEHFMETHLDAIWHLLEDVGPGRYCFPRHSMPFD